MKDIKGGFKRRKEDIKGTFVEYKWRKDNMKGERKILKKKRKYKKERI